MKFVHRNCLDHWRVDNFDPKNVTHCGTCRAHFRLEELEASVLGAEGQIWVQIVRYLGLRSGIFFAIVTMLGYIRPIFLGSKATLLFANRFLNHIALGSVSTFGLTGGYIIAQALWSINGFAPGFDGWGGSDDLWFWIGVIVIIAGALYLLYKLASGIWDIATAGKHLATANVRYANRAMRQKVVQRFRVLNYDI